MSSFQGKIIKFNRGFETRAVQFVVINGQESLLVTSKQGDVYIPLDAVEEALCDTWVYDTGHKSDRKKKKS